ncbi:MAG: hypothetical protein O2894_04735 [Planctomycetota bacterium]|nr:hypothetical protein [Planctomycetota bacterium]
MDTGNIAGRQITQRRVLGWIMLLVGLGAGAILIATGAPRWTRLLTALPFVFAALGLAQAREKV